MPARHDPLPTFIAPQLSQLVKTPPSGPGWAHELKYDGYRIHARLARGEARILTRTGLDWTDRYAATARALAALGARSAYLDGELCAVRPDGTTSFPEMQAATDAKRTRQLVYFAFDLLFLDGEPLSERPLLERKERLNALLDSASPSLRYSDHHIGDGQRFLQAACATKAEGIVSKRIDAAYAPGNRGLWQKSKCLNREEFVIVGYTEPEGSRQHIGALLLAYYDDTGRRLVYAGRAGTGMSAAELRRLHALLQPLAVRAMPLDAPPPRTSRFGSPLELSRVHWVKPELVCEVRFLSWTSDGLLRQVAYEGLRDDKPAAEVRRPRPT
ncbi:MAG TPA: non-homologous end-joining DNA ligase [Stellaceae bacterium]|nr:non-homologous end-joining DNA ligase [Stellaceae bacterium]